MKTFIRALFLFTFAFGVAAMTKHYGMAEWIENNPWVSMPMMIFGGFGISMGLGNMGD